MMGIASLHPSYALPAASVVPVTSPVIGSTIISPRVVAGSCAHAAVIAADNGSFHNEPRIGDAER
jgi:hypothetical protein